MDEWVGMVRAILAPVGWRKREWRVLTLSF